MPGPYSAAYCVGAAHLVGGGVPDAPQGGTYLPADRRAASPLAAAEEPAAPAAPTQEELLADILAELKKQNGEKTA